MAAIIKIQDIDEAISHLHYKNKETLKYKLVHAIRQYYVYENSVDSLQGINADELIKELWHTGDDPESIKSKKKNLSSIKSGVNTDLKRLYQEGKNPQGVTIGQNNVFNMSDEAKDKALEKILDVLKEKGTDTIGKITEVLSAVNDMLSSFNSFSGIEGGLEKFELMKGQIQDLFQKIGMSLPDDIDKGMAGTGGPDAVGDAIDNEAAEDVVDSLEAEPADEIVEEVILDTVREEDAADEAVDSKPEIVVDEQIGENTQYDDIAMLEDDMSEIPFETEELGESFEENFSPDEVIETVEEVIEGAAVDEIVSNESGEGPNTEEFISEEKIADSEAFEETKNDQPESELAEEADYGQMIDKGESVHELVEDLSDDAALSEDISDDELEVIEAENEPEEVESREILAEEQDDNLEEFLEEDDEAGEIVEEQEEIVEEDLYTKAELLAKLAEAAKVLEKLGPDLNGSLYTENEIKEKAKLLSEEFDRELSIREKFFNQHILIKRGEYIIGGRNGGKNEMQEQKLHLPEFYIGKFPVTNILFEIFVEKTGYRTTAERRGYGFIYTPRGQRLKDSATGIETFVWSNHLQYKKLQGACWYQPNGPGSSLHNKRRHPVVQVSLEDARAFAAWTGKRIPLEKEWEAAARTTRGYIYPWGNQWEDNSCNIEKSYFGDTTPVDNYIEFANDSGVADTLGNVLEWTLDLWGSLQSKEKSNEIYVVKGGSWISDGSISLSARYQMDKNTSSNILGFRCIAI